MRAIALSAIALGAVLCSQALSQTAPAGRSLLLVSVDGLRPDYVTEPAQAKVRIPNLRRLMTQGVYASGVRGVLPSSTYPSHTTLVTGVHPAKHGIFSNKPFNPSGKNADEWYWYAEDIRVPTLWEAAAKQGYITGSVAWPVTVGSKSIRFNIPEYAGTRSDEDIKMVRALAGPQLMAEIGASAGAYLTDVGHAIERDWARTRYAAEIIRKKHTRLMTVHLAALDGKQHDQGPFTSEAIATLEQIDRMLGVLVESIRAEDPNAAVCVVSDHGFARVEHLFKLDAALASAGFITLKSKRESLQASVIEQWEAMPWHGGGSAAVVLREASEPIRRRVGEFLKKLASDPANGIASVLDADGIAAAGGTPSAAFWVDMRPGFAFSTALEGPLVTPVAARGTHGYSPVHPEMNSSFFLEGAGIRAAANLGEIDMRAIAPTLAAVLGVPFPGADKPALPVIGEKSRSKR